MAENGMGQQPVKIFISYANEDAEIANRIYGDLKAHGFRPWLDKHDILPGEKWENKIHSAIRECDYFLALLSNGSLSKRGYVHKELQKALDILDMVPDDHIFLLPVRIDDCLPQNAKLRARQWADLFPDYEEGMARIIKAIDHATTTLTSFEHPKASEIDSLVPQPPEVPVPPPPEGQPEDKINDETPPEESVNLLEESKSVRVSDEAELKVPESSEQKVEGKPGTGGWEKISVFLFGVLFLGIMLWIAFQVPDPTNFQFWVFRVVLAMAASGVGALLPGMLNIEIKRSKLVAICAGGAIAIFVLIYLVNPEAFDPLPRTTSLKVFTEPSGAMVFLEGVEKGKSPVVLDGLLPGESVEIRAELDEYEEGRATVSVSEKNENPVTIRLKKEGEIIATSPDPLPAMEFVRIPAGEFMMGSSEDEPGRLDNERQHLVRLTEDFWMQTTEVTQGQWEAVMGENPSNFRDCGVNCPVEQVSWNDAKEFIDRLNELDNQNQYRLPTEAEWEYAARAGTETAFSWGDEADCGLANYGAGLSSECEGKNPGRPMEVQSFSPNPWGLFDMHGNVWEWCSDWYRADYYANSPVENPQGPDSGESRVVRGGSWYLYARSCRSAFRDGDVPAVRRFILGFRLVRLPGR